jgi:hypothetical protein
MIIGVLVTPPLAAQYGPLIARLVRDEYHRDGLPAVPEDLDAFLIEVLHLAASVSRVVPPGTSPVVSVEPAVTPRIMSAREAADHLGCTRQHVTRLAREGVIGTRTHVGADWQFTLPALEAHQRRKTT